MSRMEPLLDELDQLFSRKVLGSIFTAGALGEIAKEGVTYYSATPPMEMAVWFVLFVASVVTFAWWERIEAAKESAKESASETTESVSESVTESIDETKDALGDAKESLGETKESLGEAKDALGDAKESISDENEASER